MPGLPAYFNSEWSYAQVRNILHAIYSLSEGAVSSLTVKRDIAIVLLRFGRETFDFTLKHVLLGIFKGMIL